MRNTSNSVRQPSRTHSDGNISALGRGASWPRNNWTEGETREVMEILVNEFVSSNFNTVAYSKSRAPDVRFDNLSFARPPRELYNKVQNLRQRFFTPHGYLLRWADPSTEERNKRRCEKGLANNKTRESIHGIFGSDPHAAAAASAEAGDSAVAGTALGGDDGTSSSLSEKSVHYYSDIFRRRAPEVWSQSLEAYRLFASTPEYIRTASTAGSSRAADVTRSHSHTRTIQQPSLADPQQQQQQFQDMLNSPAMSLASTAMHTPSTALMSDFSATDCGVDMADEYSPYVLQAVVGHSWHKFLCDRNRWASLGLAYADEVDWETQEAEFLTQHLVSMFEFVSNVNEIPLMLVSSFTNSFDANNILQAISQADTMLAVSLTNLSSDVHQCLQYVERGGHYTMLSLCLLVDRQTQSVPSLALLVSRGDSSNRFAVFPHHDPMLSRLASSNDAMWHEFSLAGSGLVPPEPQNHGFPSMRRQSEDNSMAFTYLENGYKYAFFSRRCGHFFEMNRCGDWAPAISSTLLRPIWSSRIATRDHLVTRLREDNEKILHGMVELFGLRPFCGGFFDGIASAGNARGAAPKNQRRISDDPAYGSQRRRMSTSRLRQMRSSADAIHTLSATSSPNPGYMVFTGPGGRRSRASGSSAAIAAAAAAAAAANASAAGTALLPSGFGQPHSTRDMGAGGPLVHRSSLTRLSSARAIPYMSPQHRSVHSFAEDNQMASLSLPATPYMTFGMDGIAQSTPSNHAQYAQPSQPSLHGHNGVSSAHDMFTSLSDPSLMGPTPANAANFLPAESSIGSLASLAVEPGSSLQDDSLSMELYPPTNSVGGVSASRMGSMDAVGLLSGVAASSDVAAAAAAASSSLQNGTPYMSNVMIGGIVDSDPASTPHMDMLGNQSPAVWDIHRANPTTAISPNMGSLRIHGGSMTHTATHSPAQVPIGFRSSAADLAGVASTVALAASITPGSMDYSSFPPNVAAGNAGAPQPKMMMYPNSIGDATISMVLLDEQTASTIASVLASPEMNISLEQLSPAMTNYNVSASATPAFDNCPAPSMTPQAHALNSTLSMRTPRSLNASQPAPEDALASSAMASYFGTLTTTETIPVTAAHVLTYPPPNLTSGNQMDIEDVLE